MKQIILDSNIITDQSRSGSYNVRYALYYDGRRRRKNSIYIPENLKSEFGVDFVSNRACFAGFRGELGSYYNPDPYTKRSNKNVPIPNRIYYIPDMKSTGSPKPTLTEMYTWIRLCKQHKLLPEYVAPSVVSKGRVVFDITETSPSLLYLYLSMIRSVSEYPAFVKATVYLTSKKKVNFFAAFVYASKLYITNSGHHVLNTSRAYNSNKSSLLSLKGIEVNLMRNLKLYAENPTKYDNRRINEIAKGGYQCHNSIDNVSRLKIGVEVPDLFKPTLKQMIDARTDEEVRKLKVELDKEPKIKVILKNLSVKKEKSVGGKK